MTENQGTAALADAVDAAAAVGDTHCMSAVQSRADKA